MMNICVDAGHGGTDYGVKNGESLIEKDCMLAFSMLTGAALLERGFHVQLTRRGDFDLPFDERASTANMGGAHGFISLHCGDTVSSPGARIFALRQSARAQKWAEELAAGIKKNLCPPLSYRGIMIGNYSSLQKLQMPAVVVEIASIAHKKESLLLLDEQFMQKAAETIAESTVLFFQKDT